MRIHDFLRITTVGTYSFKKEVKFKEHITKICIFAPL
jgi:hypothetical protein